MPIKKHYNLGLYQVGAQQPAHHLPSPPNDMNVLIRKSLTLKVIK